MRKMVMVAVLLVLLPAALRAQSTPKGELGFGYSMLRYSTERTTTHGFDASIAGDINPNLAIVFDFGGHYGHFDETSGVEHLRVNLQDYSVMAGPRVSETAYKIWRPFAQFLVGYHRLNLNFNDQVLTFTPTINADTSSGVALVAGGGLDLMAGKSVALRLFQLEYSVERRSDAALNEEGARFGAGIIFLLGHRH
jgi:hypothetical protein